MSDASSPPPREPVRRQRSIYRVHYALQKRQEETVEPLILPMDPFEVKAYRLQVAGHMKTDNKRYLGVLKCNNGTILKPIIKESQKREKDFYNTLHSSNHPDLIELRSYTSKYFGCRRVTYNGFEQEYIVLEDLAERMLEPCIMDVKIGRRTWDPLASPEKIKSEQSKYARCKQQFAFCIPGYQVHRLSGRLHKYGKDSGKKLHGHLVQGAIKNFLNGMGTHICRALLLQLLSELWQIQKWSARQTAVRLYSASLLLVYDAAKLRGCCGDDEAAKARMKCAPPQLVRRKSIHSISPQTGSNFSGQLSPKGPVYKKVNSVPLTSMTLAQSSFSPPTAINSPWSEALEKLNINHSFEHNYEDNVCKIKMNYRAMLDQLSSDGSHSNPWGTVKIIDFAHVFFNSDDDQTIDENFKEGIDNFVAIFESFLRETDDQVF